MLFHSSGVEHFGDFGWWCYMFESLGYSRSVSPKTQDCLTAASLGLAFRKARWACFFLLLFQSESNCREASQVPPANWLASSQCRSLDGKRCTMGTVETLKGGESDLQKEKSQRDLMRWNITVLRSVQAANAVQTALVYQTNRLSLTVAIISLLSQKAGYSRPYSQNIHTHGNPKEHNQHVCQQTKQYRGIRG